LTIESRRSVLKRCRTKDITVSRAEKQLNGMTIRHDVLAAWRNHADDCVQQSSPFIEPSDASDDSNVTGYLVIREDCSQLLGDRRAAVHLAAIEADHQSIFGEAAGVRLRILLVPSRENRTVQLLEIGRSAGVSHVVEASNGR
jgi:hypothetical protein